ncbi:MAG: chemotaxis protein CheA [Oscillospiraceae bacterium]|nr:chemotaxis protein CheA [Oscillospiraceae bacterium]
MAKFDQGMESMVDTYIFETTSLLEQLDQILIRTESESTFGEDEINEIFRIMHTIKGSSAMMGLDNMSHLAHAVEDMFYIVREDKPVIKDTRTLYDLVFTASDLLKAEIDIVQDEDTPPTDFSEHMRRIRDYAAVLKGIVPEASERPAATEQYNSFDPDEMVEVTVVGDSMINALVTFDDDTSMANMRALLVVNNIRDKCDKLSFIPEDIESNADSAADILKNGFKVSFAPCAGVTKDDVINLISQTMCVKSCEILPSSDTKKVPAHTLTTVRVMFEPDCKMENLRAMMVVNNIHDDCELLAYYPENIETDQNTAQHIKTDGFIIRFKANIPDEEIFRTIGETPSVRSVDEVTLERSSADKKSTQSAADSNQASADAPQAGQVQSSQQPTGQQSAVKKHSDKKQSLISVNLSKLDQLLNMVGEIVIAEAMVTSNPDLRGLKLDNFQKAARQLRKLNSEMQDIVMSIRMVPISGAFNKMTRIVRDMKVKLGKDVDLVFEGEETEVDKSIIDSLNDPLMHMVRNSMDHGIEEDPQDRINAGKPAKGKITLSAYSSSGEVVIIVSDDGAGMDPQKLLTKAEKNGILTKPRSEYSDKEAMNLIMLPGFSTNEKVTEFSGRGVGMDVVKQNIEKLGGTVSVDSKPGQGTSFIVKIPLSLSIVDGMEVSVGNSIFTIPINYIKESFKLKPNQLLTDTDGHDMIMIRGECFPLIRLYELYGLEGAQENLYEGIIILAEADGKSACLLADGLMGEQQVVIKPFSPLLNNFGVKQNGMSGCSILGDGSITIILDISNIITDM